jgi:hypothetical protein
MKHIAAGIILCILGSAAAQADDAARCRANGGAFLTGTVIGGLRFAHGRVEGGVELSHTHLRLRSDQGGEDYDVAIDNVFASGHDDARESVPAPLSTIRAGDRLELCGRFYTHGGPGIDFVHTNCGEAPTPRRPDGWLKVFGSDGAPGPNLEASHEYCSIFR